MNVVGCIMKLSPISDNLAVNFSIGYVCDLCVKMFISEDNITDHMERYHESQDHLDQLHLQL